MEDNFFPTASHGKRVVPKDAAGQEEHFGICISLAAACDFCVGWFEVFKGRFIPKYSRIFEKNRPFLECFNELHNMHRPKLW